MWKDQEARANREILLENIPKKGETSTGKMLFIEREREGWVGKTLHGEGVSRSRRCKTLGESFISGGGDSVSRQGKSLPPSLFVTCISLPLSGHVSTHW